MTTSDQPIIDQDPAEPQGPDSQPPSEPLPDQPTLFVVPEDETAHPDDEAKRSEGVLDRLLAFDEEPSPAYQVSIFVGSILVLGAAALGILPWMGSVVAVVSLAATMFRGGSRLALAGAGVFVVVVMLNPYPHEATLADVVAVGGDVATAPSTPAPEVPEGSLGVRLADLAELWNGLGQPPVITRGFVRNLERGPLDSFVHQFDEGASLSGAYDPSTDYVYALVASSRIDHEAASNMYLHLCFMLHPYSQECIDAYWNEGLDGRSLEDYRGSRHSAEWEIEDETWKLTIAGDIQEIRVLGDVPG